MSINTIFVTGGAGFIGSALVRYLISESPCRVVNIDKLTYAGNLESLATVADSERYHFEHQDICDAQAITNLLALYQPDAIMHLAAESHVDRSISGPAAFIDTNITGTFTLLEAARQYWLELGDKRKAAFRFHHISTDEVYGDLEPGLLFTEQTPYAPSSPYSASKAASDHLVRAWQRTYDLPVLITNCSNNYGPYHFPEKLIPLMILNALAGKPLPIYGNGQQIRDWLYVDDHVRALYTVLNSGRVGETYNIGGHNEKTNLDVVTSLCEILEELAPEKPQGVARYQDLITHIEDRPGHDQRYAIDAGKVERELGWKPVESFDSGLRKTVEWFIANTTWVNNVSSGAYRQWINKQYGT